MNTRWAKTVLRLRLKFAMWALPTFSYRNVVDRDGKIDKLVLMGWRVVADSQGHRIEAYAGSGRTQVLMQKIKGIEILDKAEQDAILSEHGRQVR